MNTIFSKAIYELDKCSQEFKKKIQVKAEEGDWLLYNNICGLVLQLKIRQTINFDGRYWPTDDD